MIKLEDILSIDYKNIESIHRQIEFQIENYILQGILKENEQLPSIRKLSKEISVNKNTIQKSYKNLIEKNIIYSVKGKGTFVSNFNIIFKI